MYSAEFLIALFLHWLINNGRLLIGAVYKTHQKITLIEVVFRGAYLCTFWYVMKHVVPSMCDICNRISKPARNKNETNCM